MIGETLRRLRGIYGYSAREMSSLLGISSSYLSEIERGKKEPSLLYCVFPKSMIVRSSTKGAKSLFLSSWQSLSIHFRWKNEAFNSPQSVHVL